MKARWKTLTIVIIAVALGLIAAAVAFGAAPPRQAARGGAECGAWRDNPEAAKAMRALRDEHRRDMRRWLDKYGADPSSTEAQAALQKLRTEHWSDMRELRERFGIDMPHHLRTQGPLREAPGCLGIGRGLGSDGERWRTTPRGMMGGGPVRGGMMGGGPLGGMMGGGTY